MQRRPYLVSAENAELPITLEEVEALELSGGRDIAKNPRAVTHVVHRTYLALQSYIDRIHRLTYEIETLQARGRNRAGVATTLSPMDALAYLTDEQKAQLFNGIMQDSYERTIAAQRQAEAASSEASRLLARVRLASQAILDDRRLDPEIRARFQQLLDSTDTLQPATPAVTPTMKPADEQLADEQLADEQLADEQLVVSGDAAVTVTSQDTGSLRVAGETVDDLADLFAEEE